MIHQAVWPCLMTRFTFLHPKKIKSITEFSKTKQEYFWWINTLFSLDLLVIYNRWMNTTYKGLINMKCFSYMIFFSLTIPLKLAHILLVSSSLLHGKEIGSWSRAFIKILVTYSKPDSWVTIFLESIASRMKWRSS